MRINPPRIEIDPNEPFKGALFDRKAFGESLTALLKNTEESLVIFVNAPWGEGKTTFAKMWQAHLKKQNVEAIYFDAYAADYFEDPFVCFTGEILAFAKQRLGSDSHPEFKKAAIKLGKRLAGLATKIAIRAATMNAANATDVEEAKKIITDATDDVSTIGADIIEEKIDSYTEEKDALKSFRESLAKLAKQVREKQGFPLTIIVDELDRCRPDFALNLLERIKHLFDVENVAFVLLVNRVQIENYVATIYGDGVDAHSYLLKFANLFVELPVQQPVGRYLTGREEFAENLLAHHNFSGRLHDRDEFSGTLDYLILHFDLSLRDIEKVFSVLALYYSSLTRNQLTDSFLVPMLAILKVKHPKLYKDLRIGLTDSISFLGNTGLNHIRGKPIDEDFQIWISDVLNYCLMSDKDFEEAKSLSTQVNGQPTGPARVQGGLARSGLSREKVIPYLCARLDQFTLTTG